MAQEIDETNWMYDAQPQAADMGASEEAYRHNNHDDNNISDVTLNGAKVEVNPSKQHKKKKPLTRTQQIVLGVVGLGFCGVLAWALLDEPKSDPIATNMTATQVHEQASVSLPQPMEAATVMGGNPEMPGVVPGEPQQGQTAAATIAPEAQRPSNQTGGEAQQAGQTVDQLPAKAAVTQTPAVQPTTVVPQPQAQLAVAAQPDKTVLQNDPVLLAKIADLEKRLAAFESRGNVVPHNEVRQQAAPAKKRVEPKPKRKSQPQIEHQEDVIEAQTAPRATAMRAKELAAAATKAGTFPPAKSDNDQVSVSGAVTRDGRTMAIVEFAGKTYRSAEGDLVPGLGKVSRIAIQGGRPVVDINGVTYQ